MPEREGAYTYQLVLEEKLRGLHFQSVMLDGIVQAFAVIGEEELQHRREGAWGIYVQLPAASQHSHSGEQAEEAEDVVPVYVGNEYGFYLEIGETGCTYAYLGAFAAVNQKQAPTNI